MLSFLFWRQSATLLVLAALPILPQAQKVQDHQVWSTFHKTPLLSLQPQYHTYSLNYDFGNAVMSVNNRPTLQTLTYQKADGDLLLSITVKNLFITGRKLTESTTRGGYSAYYTLSYSGDFGYELRDVKADKMLARFHKDGGTTTTRAFSNGSDLEGYVNNAFVGEKTRLLLDEMSRRADFALNPHDYAVGLTLHTVEGTAPAHAALNEATAGLQALVAAAPAGTAPARADVLALAAVWQRQLEQANWEDKKSPINKKVANVLLENLCASALLTEDYAKLGGYASEYIAKNKSLFGDGSLSFLTDLGYGGLSRRPVATFAAFSLRQAKGPERVAVFYDELAADVVPAK